MLLPLVMALAAAPTAEAAESGIHMWGVGPTISTIAYPGRHPISFPKLTEDEIADNGFQADVNENRRITSVDEVKGDMGVGARGIVYFNRSIRGGIRFHAFTLGNNYNSADVTFEVDKIFFQESKASAFGGLGLGFGNMKFEGETEAANGEDPVLSMATYLVRGQAGGMYRWKQTALEVGLFANMAIPGVIEFTGQSGNTVEIGGFGGNGVYWHGGLEATMYFGDFTPPKNAKKKGKKGKKKKK
jgi:hypothetical protein